MSFLKRNTAKRRPTVLNCNLLEARDVPTQFDLTGLGSSAVIDGAIFEQAAAPRQFEGTVGAFSSFLRIDGNGDEQGYNTSARPLQYDTVGSRAVTHALDINDVPLVTIGETQYREFVLDINQRRGLPTLSVDQIQVFVSDNPNLRGYNQLTGKLGGLTAVYDTDTGPTNDWIKLNANRGFTAAEGGDMRMYVPNSLFTGGQYVFVYSHFGDRFGANGGAETWGTVSITPPAPPPPPTTTGSFEGRVWADLNNNGSYEDGEGLGGITVFADMLATDFSGSDGIDQGEVSIATGADGRFTLSGVALEYDAINDPEVTLNEYNVRMNGPNSFFHDMNGDNVLSNGDTVYSLVLPDPGSPYHRVSPSQTGLDFVFVTSVFDDGSSSEG